MSTSGNLTLEFKSSDLSKNNFSDSVALFIALYSLSSYTEHKLDGTKFTFFIDRIQHFCLDDLVAAANGLDIIVFATLEIWDGESTQYNWKIESNNASLTTVDIDGALCDNEHIDLEDLNE